jgi:hypothetical protein
VDAMTAETQKAMYYCLVDLSKILDRNDFSGGYIGEENFQEDCFITLATVIKEAFLPVVLTSP